MRCACGAAEGGTESAQTREKRRKRKRIGEDERTEEEVEEGEKKKGPDPASKRLDREPKRNKLLHELVAVVPSVLSSFPRVFL